MVEGKRFLGATGIPMWKIARVRIRLAVWLPEPLTVAAWFVSSLMFWSVTLVLGDCEFYAHAHPELVWFNRLIGQSPHSVKVGTPKQTAPDERRLALDPD